MLYTVAKGSMIEESLPLDLLLASYANMKELKTRLLTFKTSGTAKIDGVDAYVVEGMSMITRSRAPIG